MIVGDGKGLHLVQVQVFVAVRLKNHRADAGQLQALLHARFGDSESRRDVGRSRAVVDQLPEGVELVGRMHRHAHHVLGKADLRGVGAAWNDTAGHRSIGGYRSALRKD